MHRNELTTPDKLTIGDRFYKASDKKKVSYKIADFETKKGIPIVPSNTPKDLFPRYLSNIKRDLQVVFLRHETDIC